MTIGRTSRWLRRAALAAFALLFASPASAYKIELRIRLPALPVDQLEITARVGNENETYLTIDKPGREAVATLSGDTAFAPDTPVMIFVLPMLQGYQTAEVQCRRYRGILARKVVTITCVDNANFTAFGEDPEPAPPQPPPSPEASVLPNFPWEPPAPSERMNLDRPRLAAGLPANASLLDLANKMTRALNGAGYSEYSFFRAPGGFALVARLEQFNPDGSPKPQSLRFLDPNTVAPFSLAAYIKQLFFAPEGYYRLIVFVATDRSFVASAPSPTAAHAEAWLRKGANTLPQQYATLPFSPGHQVTALIYEFRKYGNAPIATLDPGQLDANTHLVKAGLLERLLGH